MLGNCFKNKNTPSVIALSRQKLPYINPMLSEKNKCEKGAYVVKITSHDNKVTLVASGSEVELALNVQKSLKENNIESKVVSMPCQELFDKQTDDFKKDILDQRLFNCYNRSWRCFFMEKVLWK